MIARRLIVVVVALLLAVQVVRNAAVAALAPLHPITAARFWPTHPAVKISLGLSAIGSASRERKIIDPRIFSMIDDAAVESPLSPEPFLVRGVRLQSQADAAGAKRAFLAAQWRDPRSLPAAYFLASYYFENGDAQKGLEQTAVLVRLSPNGRAAIAPFVAAFARERSYWPQIRAMFRSEQSLEDSVLASLAQDPRNTDALLALADADHRRPDSPWLISLLSKLVVQGDFARARALWSSIGRGGAGGQLVFDANFSNPVPPPPFNWSLSSANVGLAERQPGGRLHAIFYGNVDGVLASQLLLLPPGAYQLRMQLVGSPQHPETLHWSTRCSTTGEPLGSVAVDEAASRSWTFRVPANCPAQWLELSARSGDVAQQADVTIGGFALTRVADNG